MDPVEPSPNESPVRMPLLRISRDTAILLASLIFLACAILLAVLFPPSGSEPARALTPVATIAQATAIVVEPAQLESPVPTLLPTDVVLPSTDQQPYPPPAATLPVTAFSSTPEPTPAIAFSPTPELPIPTVASEGQA